MKKIFFAVLLILIFSAFAEMYPAKRTVEFGTNINVHASENLIRFTDVFKEEIVLDMNNISSRMGKNGFIASAAITPETYIDFNFRKFGFGLHAGADISGRLNVSKDLFDILAKGITTGETKNIEMNTWLQSFVTASTPFYFKIKRFKINVTPSYFMPMFYIPYTTAKATAVNNRDGTTSIKANVPIDIYTVQEFDGLIDDGDLSMDFISEIDASSLSKALLANGGLDIGVLVEYPFTPKLDLGAYVNIPIVPGRLKHKLQTTFNASIEIPSVMDIISDDAEIEKSSEFTDAVYSEETYIVNRPLRFGAEIAYHPWRKWMTLRAAFGFAFRNPFGKDFNKHSFYPEYNFGAEFTIAYFLGLNFYTEYTQQVFAHTFQLILNARALEIDIGIAVCNASFVHSFRFEGARTKIGLKMGW